MNVTHDGLLYTISWSHNQKHRLTTCRIERLRIGLVRSSVQANTRVHPKDQYVKEIGRKHSLLAAVKMLNLDKAGRTVILKAYFNRKINPPAPKPAKVLRCRNCESNPAQADCATCGMEICSGCRDTDGNCPYCSRK